MGREVLAGRGVMRAAASGGVERSAWMTAIWELCGGTLEHSELRRRRIDEGVDGVVGRRVLTGEVGLGGLG